MLPWNMHFKLQRVCKLTGISGLIGWVNIVRAWRYKSCVIRSQIIIVPFIERNGYDKLTAHDGRQR